MGNRTYIAIKQYKDDEERNKKTYEKNRRN